MRVDLVLKLGGRLLAHPSHLDAALAALRAAAGRRLLVVPGGGPFADAVREADARIGLSDTAAHWMAVLGMDQHAHLLADRLTGGVVTAMCEEIPGVIERRGIPVLAPFRWLRAADPLPHSWDVTADSIAAWVSGQLGARRLLLVKAPGATGDHLVDGWFEHARPPEVQVEIIGADQLERLRRALAEP